MEPEIRIKIQNINPNQNPMKANMAKSIV